jgi:uncharacterized membrane protein YgaE (UPF0421/DUF939 family)
MDYKEQRAFEATLTTAQRKKIRTLEKDYEQRLTPIRNFHWKRYEEVKREAFKSENCEQRVKEIREANAPILEAIKEQIRQLQEQQTQILDEARVQEEAIWGEAYNIASNDPQVLATGEIWKEIKETYAKQKEELFASLQK